MITDFQKENFRAGNPFILSKEGKIWRTSKQKSLQEHAASLFSQSIQLWEQKDNQMLWNKVKVKKRQQALELHACFKLLIQSKLFSSAW